MSTSSLLLCFDTESAWEEWLKATDALAGLPDGKGTHTMTYPIAFGGKIYCFVPDTCPKDALPPTLYCTRSVELSGDGTVQVNLITAPEADIESFKALASATERKINREERKINPVY